MNRAVLVFLVVGMGMILWGSALLGASRAKEWENQKPHATQSHELKDFAGMALPDPPEDPQCPYGADPVGSISLRSFVQPCTVNGKDVTRICISKTQLCEEGVAVPPNAYEYNCAPCVDPAESLH